MAASRAGKIRKAIMTALKDYGGPMPSVTLTREVARLIDYKMSAPVRNDILKNIREYYEHGDIEHGLEGYTIKKGGYAPRS